MAFWKAFASTAQVRIHVQTGAPVRDLQRRRCAQAAGPHVRPRARPLLRDGPAAVPRHSAEGFPLHYCWYSNNEQYNCAI